VTAVKDEFLYRERIRGRVRPDQAGDELVEASWRHQAGERQVRGVRALLRLEVLLERVVQELDDLPEAAGRFVGQACPEDTGAVGAREDPDLRQASLERRTASRRDVRDGRADRSIGETYRMVQPRLPAVIAAGILAAIAIGIGLLLVIVPGLFLLTIWSMLIPVIVLEGRSAGDSFSRSREVVRGNGWSVFGLILITFLLVAIATGVIRVIFNAILPDFVDTWLGSLVGHSLTVPFAAATLTTAYFHLTTRAPAAPAPQAPVT
jgi:hypothetical protein